MIRVFSIALALGSMSAAHAQSLERQRHDHIIYAVHGSADQLRKFQDEVGSQWEGGVLLDTDVNRGISRYWAFSDRTASQARQLMLGSLMSGLQLDIEAYEEQRFFPTERFELDSIALKCGFTVDPFFITPQRELHMGPAPTATLQGVECALTEIKASKTLGALPMGLVGKAPAKEVK